MDTLVGFKDMKPLMCLTVSVCSVFGELLAGAAEEGGLANH